MASDEWMAEQQLRAELEAEAWRRLRETALPPPAAAAALPAPRRDPSLGGSIVLKALVRFAMGATGGYLAYIAAIDAELGSFEAWLAVIAAFLVTLSLSLLAPFRRMVHATAETARWAIIAALGFGLLWVLLNNPGAQ
jgi:hypothetical protein